MANTIMLGGAERALRYDLNAIEAIGDRLDIKVRVAHVGEDLLSTPVPLGALKIILWAGLLHYGDEAITPEVAGSWVDQHNLREVLAYFFGLFNGTSQALRAQVAEKLGVEMDEASVEDAVMMR